MERDFHDRFYNCTYEKIRKIFCKTWITCNLTTAIYFNDRWQAHDNMNITLNLLKLYNTRCKLHVSQYIYLVDHRTVWWCNSTVKYQKIFYCTTSDRIETDQWCKVLVCNLKSRNEAAKQFNVKVECFNDQSTNK